MFRETAGTQLSGGAGLYRQFIRFMLPLVLTMVVYALGSQVLNGGMARLPGAAHTLAAFGLAWGLVEFLASPLSQVRQLGLVLVDSHLARRRIQWFVWICGLGLGAVLLALAFTVVGDWVLLSGHRISAELAATVRTGLAGLALIPLIEGSQRYYSGLLMQARRTEVLTYATAAHIVAGVVAVLILLPLPLVRQHPILMPLVATYCGLVADLGVLLWGYRRYVRQGLPATSGKEYSLGYIGRFFWPLALVMAVQGFSRPLVNLMVARGQDGVEALAVLAVVYPLAHMPYGWLNELRSLPAAFRRVPASLPAVRRFSTACGLVSFGLMVLFFWTPLRTVILEGGIGLDADLAALCRWPLFLFAVMPLCVMGRAYLHGVALLQHRTHALAPSGPARIAIIFAVLDLVPETAAAGAVRGVGALVSGFCLEVAVVWWGVRRSGTQKT